MSNNSLNPAPGTYVLVFQCLSSKAVQVGKWGQLNIYPGFYLYVGSAFGPGGIKSRVARHHRTDKSRHWHIDYLRDYMKLITVWYSYDSEKQEHHWARALSAIRGMEPVPGFGCSDCTCYSHLYRTDSMPEQKQFTDGLVSDCGKTVWQFQF